jgi:uncharacterized membrane protein YozB (DUF420 family)
LIVELAAFNATLNGVAALLLACGLAAIRARRRALHAGLMRAAFLVSAAFLASYGWLHWPEWIGRAEPRRFGGTGAARALYLALLGSHTLLAVANVPLVLRTLWLAHRERWDAHKRLARWTFPIWLYVSVTGVLVYLVLYRWNPAPPVP